MPSIAEIKQQYPDLAGLGDEQVVDAVHQAFYPEFPREEIASSLGLKPAAAPVPERSTARAAGDIALSLGQGAIGSVKSITDLAGADNPVSQGLGGMSEYLGNQKSDQSKEVLRRSKERVNAAEESGSTWEEAKAYMEMLLDQPGEFMAQGVGSFATLGLGKIAQAAKLATAAKAAGMTKGAFLATQAGKEAIKEAAKFGFKANIGVGVAQGVGAVKGSQYEQTYNNAIAQGMPEDQAQALAAEAQRYGGAGTMQQALGGALGGVAAATGPIERMVVGKGASQSGVLASMGKGLLVEGGTEGGQGAQERFAGNTAAIDSGVLAPDQRMRGVAGQGLMEGTIGGVLGAAVGPFEAQEPVAPAPAGPMTRAIAKTPGAATWSTSLGAAESATPKVTQEDVLGKFEPEFETSLGAAPEKAPGIDLPREFDTGNLSYGSAPEYGDAFANPTRPVDAREFDTGTLAIDSGQTAQDQEAATAANIQQAAQRRAPMTATAAANVLVVSREKGLDFTVAPHPDGGFLVVPRAWVTPQVAEQAEASLRETLGRVAQAEDAPVTRAQRSRSDGQALDLNTDPVAGYIEDLRKTNTPAARAYVGEFDAGRVTRADVEQRMAIERGKTPDERLAEAAADGLKLNPKNEPFKTLVAARLAAKTTPGTVIEVPGGYAIRTKPGGNAPAADQAGDWQRFSPETGTLNIPREEMPQVKNAHRGPLVNFLGARGVTHEQVEIDPAELKPSQDGFSASKVDEAADADTDRAILISSDNHIIDGHHQAVAKLKTGQPVRAIRLNAPAADLLPMVLEFPSSTTEKQANEQDAASQPAGNQKTGPGPVDVAARANGEGGPAVPQAAEELPGALINVQDAPQAATGAPATTGAQATGAQAQADQTPAPARGDGAVAGGVPAAGAGAGVRADGVTKPPFAKNEDVEHLFGVDVKRQKAIERVNKGTAYFATAEKAADFIKAGAIKDTHEVVQAKPGRFEVRAKAGDSGMQTEDAAPANQATNPGQKPADAPAKETAIARRNRLIAEREEAAASQPKTEKQPQASNDAGSASQPEPTKPAPTANTIFTEDAAAAARARLKAKLGRLNSGLDPEMMMDGITLAGYHIEKGARTFAAYAKAMVADLGDGVKPYLKSWYMGVRFDPRAGAFDGMDSPAVVEAADVDAVAKEEPPAKTLTESLYQAIRDNAMPKDNPALKKLVEAFDGKPADQERMKQAQEELETAIVMVARDMVAKKEGDRTTFDILLRLYERQPNLNIRTSTSIANQAYSTPAPLAYLASRLAGITKDAVAHEPTGGTGMLLIGADPDKAIVNELNDIRIKALKAQGFKPTQKDAATQTLVPEGTQPDSVVTNPPFGSIKDAEGKPVKVKVDGFSLGQIDHLIAARALDTMKEDGRATLILGANKLAGGLSTDDRIFFNWLYSHYNVVGHFEIDGDLYNRQGAGWPVRVITINGRQKSDKFSPVAGAIQRVDNWNAVYEQFTQSLASAEAPRSRATTSADSAGGRIAAAVVAPSQAGAGRPEGGARGAGNVAGASPRVVPDRAKPAAGPVAAEPDEQRLNAQSHVPQPQPGQSLDGADRLAKPAGNAAVAETQGNEFQLPYTPRSSRKDEGVLIPANMAQPTQDALSRLEDEVGDIDEFARKELGYETTKDLHEALMGLQVDSVAMSIYQIKQGKAVVIADQTGIGKGRQAASIIRWAARQGMTPVFVSVKPSLFTDMYGDLADIGTTDVTPFIMNSDAWVAGEGGAKLFANKPGSHKNVIQEIANTGRLPEGCNAVFMTYSQINVANVQRQALMALAPNAVFVLDESHNAAGASATGEFVIGTLEAAKGVVYLSATYAKRPDNMPLYFKTDIGEAAADTEGLSVAMASGGLPLQTVVSNNLVKAGQMFRRERSYDGVSIASVFDSKNRELHERMSNEATKALRAIVSADRMFHEVYVKQLADQLAEMGATVQDSAGNQIEQSVQHTEFSSVVHNFVKQMLLGLKAQSAADEAIASLKRGEKPIIAVENTMGSFLNEYAAANGIGQGESLGTFDYRTVLSRALARSRVVIEVGANGDKVKRAVPMEQLDAMTKAAYNDAQAVIDSLTLEIPVSPIDWMRSEITRAGYKVAEITGRNLSVDYTNPKKPELSAIDVLEQKDKVNTTRQFNSGNLDALILNVAGSTGISLHASERFEDQRQRHMIVAQAAGDINIFMQMLGRVHRTGQVRLPKYTILSVDLPTEKRPTALLSIKMKSLNANTSSNTESATSVKSVDILNKYGDQIVNQYLRDNYALARALDLEDSIGDDPTEDIARKATGRLALQPIATQHTFYDEVEAQYNALIDYLNKTNQNDLEPRTFDFDAKEIRQEVLFDGPNKDTPFGEDAIYGEYSIKAQGTPMKPEEIRATMAEHLGELSPAAYTQKMLDELDAKFNTYYATLEDAGKDGASSVRNIGRDFLSSHRIGSTFRVDINSEPFNAVVLNVRNTHKETGNPYSLSKIQVSVAVNGALRSLSVPATQFSKIEVSSIAPMFKIEQLFKEQPPNQRETAKIITGNLLAAYGEMQGVRGTIISFTKQDGTTEQGILLPKLFDYGKNTRGDFRLPSGEAALHFLQKSDNKDIGRFGIMTRDGNVRVLPSGQGIRVQVPKSKLKGGKYFLDKGLIQAGGDFVSSGSFMVSNVTKPADAVNVLDLLMKKQALYALPSMADEAKQLTDGMSASGSDDATGNVAMFSRSPMKSVDANIRRGLESLAKALDERTTVHRAMFRNGLGWVDFVWGSEGTTKASGKSKGAMGLSHIMEARQRKDGLTDAQTTALLEDIVNAIASGTEFSRAELQGTTRVGLERRDTVVWLTKQKGSNAWIVTAYEKNPDGANAGRATFAPTSPAASLTRDQRVAGFGDIVRAADPEVKLSRATGSPDGITKEAATQIVDAIRGRWANAPEVVVVQDMQDPAVPQRVRDADLDQRSMGAAGEPEGFWYGGKAYIVASALSTPGDVVRVLFHEVLGHYGLRGTFGDSLAPILRQIASLRRNEIVVKAFEYGLVPKDLNPRATMQEVWAAMSDAQRLQAAEEVLAVMAQTKPEMGYVKRAIAAVRAWLRKNVPGFQDMKLTDDEIIQQFILPARRFVERGPADARARRGGSVSLPALSFSMAPQGVLDELAKLDGLFAVAKSSQKTMEGVIGELAPLWQVKKITNIPGRTQYNITTADGNTARVIERPFNPYGESIYGYDLDASGEMAGEVVGRPGDNPEDAPAADDVWIDVSLLREGGKDGELIYQAVANFAHNTGKVFIGDPAGLSDQALRRRTEQMLSSALKHGTTRHIAPHPRQVSGDAKLGVPGLKWVYGDDIGNVERMIDVSLKSLENAFPSAKLIGYDSATNQFYRTDTGQRFANRGQLARVVGQSIESRLRLAGRKGGQGEAGWRTIARGALFNDLKAALAVESTSRDRGSVLGGLREVGARLERDGATGEAYPAQERIFYSRRRDGLTSEDGAALFSRSADAPNDPRALVQDARQAVNDLFSHPGKLSFWHKSVGTQYDLAQRSPAFKKVYDRVQDFLGDVSYHATQAADQAPSILPKLDTWRDIFRSPLTPEDNKAIAAPIFEGTLAWRRDESGKPVRMSDVEAAAGDLTTEQKAQRLLRGDHVTERTLKMWRGLPVEQYETIIEGKFEREMLAAGIVWTDAELKEIFNLSPKQISLYREFRSATDKSLSSLAISDMLRFGGKDTAALQAQAMDAEDANVAAVMLRDHLMSLAEQDGDRRELLIDTANKMIEKADKVQALIDRGYAPLSRFGHYSLDVLDADGERVYFGLFESKAEANKMARAMRINFPGAQISQGTMSEEAYKLFAGVSPETLELFGGMLGLESDGSSASDRVFQEYLKLAKGNRSAMKRLIQRKGIAGFSEDAGRVLAGFIYSNARQVASGLHMGAMAEAASAIPNQQGELKDAALKLVDYIKNPVEEAAKFRGLLFAQYLGGSLASAMVNMLQPIQVTIPYLSQFGGARGAALEMKRALGDVLKKTTGDKDLDDALRVAEEEGIVAPQEVHQLMAQAQGQGSLKSGDGTAMGNAKAKASNAVSKVSLAWGKAFGAAEQFNRRLTFIAAYRLAKAQGIDNPAAFAEKTIAETQFVYNKGNKPRWARGAVGGTIFTFKQYSISYLELLSRMATAGEPGSPERAAGRKAALMAVGVLLLMGGAGGLPFMEDLEDLIDGFMQRVLGYNFSTKQKRKELLAEVFGEEGARFVESGLSGLPGAPVDVSGRLGLGNLIPGTGLFVKKDNYSRDIVDAVGPAGDLVRRGFTAAGQLLGGDVGKAAETAAPVAARNLIKAVDMANMGMYRDDRGRKVIDTEGYEALAKAIGFQPNTVARVQDGVSTSQRMISLNKMTEAEIASDWAQGIFEQDQGKVQAARAALQEWNRKNPESPIRINMAQILKRVRAMRTSKEDRIAATAPKEIRAAVRRELQAAGQ